MGDPVLGRSYFADYELVTFPGYFKLFRIGDQESVATYLMKNLEPTADELQSQALDIMVDIYRDNRRRWPDIPKHEAARRALEALNRDHAPCTDEQKAALVVFAESRREYE